MNIEHLTRVRDVLSDMDVLMHSTHSYLRNFKFDMGVELNIDEAPAVSGCILGLSFLLACDEAGYDSYTMVRIMHSGGMYSTVMKYLDVSEYELNQIAYPDARGLRYSEISSEWAARAVDHFIDYGAGRIGTIPTAWNTTLNEMGREYY